MLIPILILNFGGNPRFPKSLPFPRIPPYLYILANLMNSSFNFLEWTQSIFHNDHYGVRNDFRILCMTLVWIIRNNYLRYSYFINNVLKPASIPFWDRQYHGRLTEFWWKTIIHQDQGWNSKGKKPEKSKFNETILIIFLIFDDANSMSFPNGS